MKIFWFDTETTGLDPCSCSVIQIGYIVEIDEEVLEEGTFFCAPFAESNIQPEAMRVNGRSEEEINGFPAPQEFHRSLLDVFGTYVDRYDKTDKFVAAGYNVGFDIDFLSATWKRLGDNYFGSWFWGCHLDVRTIVTLMKIYRGLNLPDYKLTTVCGHFGIEFEAHNAVGDIAATRDLYQIIRKEVLCQCHI